MQSNKTYILYVVFFFHMKTSQQNCCPVCLVTERAQACDTSVFSFALQIADKHPVYLTCPVSIHEMSANNEVS